MKKLVVVMMVLFLFSWKAQSQTDLLFELQAYPTGLIPGVKVERHFGEKSSGLIRVGFNLFDHRDLGVHDSETGNGFGFTLGYKKYFSIDHRGWHLALKNDFWWNKVDWYDIGVGDLITEGETSITVIQPTLELGFTFVNTSQLVFTPTIAFGTEWNVSTDGAPTGEGAILLIGVQVGKRF